MTKKEKEAKKLIAPLRANNYGEKYYLDRIKHSKKDFNRFADLSEEEKKFFLMFMRRFIPTHEIKNHLKFISKETKEVYLQMRRKVHERYKMECLEYLSGDKKEKPDLDYYKSKYIQ